MAFKEERDVIDNQWMAGKILEQATCPFADVRMNQFFEAFSFRGVRKDNRSKRRAIEGAVRIQNFRPKFFGNFSQNLIFRTHCLAGKIIRAYDLRLALGEQ